MITNPAADRHRILDALVAAGTATRAELLMYADAVEEAGNEKVATTIRGWAKDCEVAPYIDYVTVESPDLFGGSPGRLHIAGVPRPAEGDVGYLHVVRQLSATGIALVQFSCITLGWCQSGRAILRSPTGSAIIAYSATVIQTSRLTG